MSTAEQRILNREKYDKLLGLAKRNKNNNTTNNKNTNATDNNNIKLDNLSVNTISNIDNLSNKQLNKIDNNTNATLVNNIQSGTKEKTQQLKQNIKEKTQRLKKQTKRGVNKLLGREVDENNNNNRPKNDKTKPKKKVVSNILSIIMMAIVFLGFMFAVRYYYINMVIEKSKGIYLLDNTKDAKNPLVISQDSNQISEKLITKSFNKPGGMEFTYSFWIVINNMNLVNKGKWKHVFHKGERNMVVNGEPNKNGIMSPGVFVHPNTNTIRIYMNVATVDPPNLLEYIDISNIPLKKWVNITFTFTEQKDTVTPNNNDKLHNCLDVYINGLLKTRKQFTILPTLNEGDLWINNFSCFDGFISKMK